MGLEIYYILVAGDDQNLGGSGWLFPAKDKYLVYKSEWICKRLEYAMRNDILDLNVRHKLLCDSVLANHKYARVTRVS